MKAKTIT